MGYLQVLVQPAEVTPEAERIFTSWLVSRPHPYPQIILSLDCLSSKLLLFGSCNVGVQRKQKGQAGGGKLTTKPSNARLQQKSTLVCLELLVSSFRQVKTIASTSTPICTIISSMVQSVRVFQLVNGNPSRMPSCRRCRHAIIHNRPD